MPRDTTRRRLLGGCGAAGLAALAGCTGSTPFVGRRLAETEEIDPEDAEAVSIEGSVGDVELVGTDRETVHLDIEKQSSSVRADLEDLHLRTDREAGTLTFRSEWEGSTGWFEGEPSMHFDVEVPGALAVERVRASTGRITVRNVGGDVDVRTSTGSVEVESVDGTVTAEASTGSVEIRDVEAVGDLMTSTGSVDAEVPAIDGDTMLSTSTGSVDAAVDPDLDADLFVTTSTGSVDVDVDLADEFREGDTVRGTLGEGGPTLHVETSTGSVTVTELE